MKSPGRSRDSASRTRQYLVVSLKRLLGSVNLGIERPRVEHRLGQRRPRRTIRLPFQRETEFAVERLRLVQELLPQTFQCLLLEENVLAGTVGERPDGFHGQVEPRSALTVGRLGHLQVGDRLAPLPRHARQTGPEGYAVAPQPAPPPPGSVAPTARPARRR